MTTPVRPARPAPPKTTRSRAALAAILESGQVRTDSGPHLPPADTPLETPPRRIFLQVTENDVHADRDGGRVVLQGMRGREDPRLIGAYLTLVYDSDGALWEFPALRADMLGTVYELVLRETTLAEVPADPDAVPPARGPLAAELERLTRENAELQRQLAATHDPATSPDLPPSA